MVGIHDIYAAQNSQYSITFRYYDASDVAIPITDVVEFVVRRSALPQEKNEFEILSSGSADEGYLPFPDTDYNYGQITITTNQIVIDINSKTMASIPTGSYFYYLNLINGEEVTGLLKGRFYVEAP